MNREIGVVNEVEEVTKEGSGDVARGRQLRCVE